MTPMAMLHALEQVGKPSGYAPPAIDNARRALAGLSNGQLSFGYMINTNAWLLHDDISIENYRRFEVAYPLGCISLHPDRQSPLPHPDPRRRCQAEWPALTRSVRTSNQ